MGAAAQLPRPGPADLHDPDLLAVRLVEQGEGAKLPRLGQRHPAHADRQVTAQRTAALRLHLRHRRVQHGRALPQGGAEGFLLARGPVGDPVVRLGHLGMAGRHAVPRDRQQVHEYRFGMAQLTRGADRAAQDVAAALVARAGAVGEQHQGGADVVGDHAQPDVGLRVRAVAHLGQGRGPVQYGADLVIS